MPFHSLDLAVFVGFFVVVIGLSVWKSRTAKGTTTTARISSSPGAA